MLWAILLTIVIVIIIIICFVVWLAYTVVFFPSKDMNKDPKDDGYSYKDRFISVKDPNRWYYPDDIRDEPCINVWHFDTLASGSKRRAKRSYQEHDLSPVEESSIYSLHYQGSQNNSQNNSQNSNQYDTRDNIRDSEYQYNLNNYSSNNYSIDDEAHTYSERSYVECSDPFGKPHVECEELTVLYFHGTSGNVSDRSYVIDICSRFHLNLLLVDYRGYGRSDGEANPHNIYEDGEAAYQYLIGHCDPKNIIVWGESLGGTVACHVASNFECKALILLATFSSLSDVIREKIGNCIIANVMCKLTNMFFHSMESKVFLSHIKCRVAIMHSEDDKLIPYSCAGKLYRAIPHDKKILYTIEGGHATPEPDDYTLRQLFEFVGIETRCMTREINETLEDLAKLASENPGLLPTGIPIDL